MKKYIFTFHLVERGTTKEKGTINVEADTQDDAYREADEWLEKNPRYTYDGRKSVTYVKSELPSVDIHL